VQPRWPYDMRPSARAEKHIRDAAHKRKPKFFFLFWMFGRKTVPNVNNNGTDGQTDGQTDRRTDRQTDRVRRNMRPPPSEEGRIIILTQS